MKSQQSTTNQVIKQIQLSREDDIAALVGDIIEISQTERSMSRRFDTLVALVHHFEAPLFERLYFLQKQHLHLHAALKAERAREVALQDWVLVTDNRIKEQDKLIDELKAQLRKPSKRRSKRKK